MGDVIIRLDPVSTGVAEWMVRDLSADFKDYLKCEFPAHVMRRSNVGDHLIIIRLALEPHSTPVLPII